MRRIREALRLHLQAGLSYNEVGRALKISKSVVGKYVSLARVAGVDCAVADGCAGQVFSDTTIGCLIADCCSKALGGKLPSLECSRTLL